ncbi:MAG: DUF5666 domain-containing protein [Gammaproteobacteria bacterium]|nr:DUF5666 domain-containing protein [Gammaproteobacteria bacterium]
MKTFTIFAVLLSTVLVACGGGGGNSVAGIDARGTPVPVAVVAKGTIAGFGSVIVNGVRYDTSAATFDVDDSPGVQGDLRIGQVVVVRGTLNDDSTTGVADSVQFDDVVEGPISSINMAAATITVLDQIVMIDADTSFDDRISPASIEGLAVNDTVEVSGFFRADGSIAATRIETKPPGTEFEVTGIVRNVTAANFMINNLVVNYSAAQLDNFPTGAPETGQLVEAKGNNLGGSGELLATRVEFKGNDIGGANGDQIEVEGFITRFVAANDFDVEGIPVITTASTAYVNGTSADLALNRKVEVEGTINAAGAISATKVEIKLAGFIRIEGMVDATTANSVTIFGITVGVDSLTRIEDKSNASVDPFRLADINVGDYLETRGYEDASGIVATRVEREDFQGDVAIRAFVDSVADPDFTIRGVLIQTNGSTTFRDINDQIIPASGFFGQAMGRLVEADGSLSNGGILADQVDLEN